MAQAADHLWKPLTYIDCGDAYLILGDRAAAQRSYRHGLDWLEAHGEQAWISTYAAVYASLFLDALPASEAWRWLDIAKRATVPDDVLSEGLVRILEGQLLAHEGRYPESRRLMAEGIDWIARSDQSYNNGLAQQQ